MAEGDGVGAGDGVTEGDGVGVGERGEGSRFFSVVRGNRRVGSPGCDVFLTMLK